CLRRGPRADTRGLGCLVTAMPHEVKWLIASADEVAAARDWLAKNACEGSWQLDLLGLEAGANGSGRASIAVRCAFADKEQSRAFVQNYLKAAAMPAVP